MMKHFFIQCGHSRYGTQTLQRSVGQLVIVLMLYISLLRRSFPYMIVIFILFFTLLAINNILLQFLCRFAFNFILSLIKLQEAFNQVIIYMSFLCISFDFIVFFSQQSDSTTPITSLNSLSTK